MGVRGFLKMVSLGVVALLALSWEVAACDSDGFEDSKKQEQPQFIFTLNSSAGRSHISINRVVMQNMPALRHAYNRRLREKPDLDGVITVKFAIEASGKVFYTTMLESTINDPDFEKTVVDRVKSWDFGETKPGDLTEVTYPFQFSPL
jgi:TonB family protein